MKLCIRSQDTGAKNIDQLVCSLKGFEFDGVQLVCYKTFDDIAYQQGSINQNNAAKIGDILKANQKSVELVGAYFNPVHPDPQKVEKGKSLFKEYIDYAALLGGGVVGSETGSYNGDKWTYHPQNRTEEALDIVVDTFKELCTYALERGIRVGIEGAAGHICWNIATLERAAKRIDCANLDIIFDLYNFLDNQNYGEYKTILDGGISTFGNKILLFHLKDCIIKDGILTQCPLGEGFFDFDYILSKIKAHNKNAVLVLEGTTGDYIIPAIRLIKEKWGKL